MADYGAAVSQKGYDVKTCADRFLVYSSAFQSLKIFSVSSVTTTVPASGTNTATVTHNLGYYTPYIVIYNGNTTEGTGTSYFFSNGIYGLETRGYDNKIEIDVDEYFADTGDTVYFTVYVFLDGFGTVAEKNINTGTTSGSSSTDYGMRISKSGYDVKTTADVNCVLSSSFSSEIIHKKGSTTTATVTHNLSYIPNVLAYIRFSSLSETFISYMYGNDIMTTSSNIQMIPTGQTYYYVIFKNKLT